MHAKNLEITLLIVDFSKAFDSIYREKRGGQILPKYGLPKEIVLAIKMLDKKKIRFAHLIETDFFDIVVGVMLRDT